MIEDFLVLVSENVTDSFADTLEVVRELTFDAGDILGKIQELESRLNAAEDTAVAFNSDLPSYEINKLQRELNDIQAEVTSIYGHLLQMESVLQSEGTKADVDSRVQAFADNNIKEEYIRRLVEARERVERIDDIITKSELKSI